MRALLPLPLCVKLHSMRTFKKANSNGKGLSHPAVKVLILLNIVVLGVGLYIYFRDQAPGTGEVSSVNQQATPSPDSLNSERETIPGKNDEARAATADRDETRTPVRESKPEPSPSSPPVKSNPPAADNIIIASRGKQVSPLVIRTTNDRPATRYTVAKGQAHFHNRPDPSTRRKAFINHWNKAVLQPLDEQNGFVYIVYTNHLGQTSKGWLKIQDLQALPAK